MKKYLIPRIRLGGTSFLLHAGYVPAVRFAAERCEDVALLLLETGRHGEWLPTIREINEIRKIIIGEGASLHVHLPIDADFDTPEGASTMADNAVQAVERAGPLHPHSFVLHVDFPSLHTRQFPKLPGGELAQERHAWTAEALARIAARLPMPEALAIENLEHLPIHFWDAWLDTTPYSRCLDIGHIWKSGGDPVAAFTAWQSRIRLIHLHGLDTENRDHASLRLMPPARLDAIMHTLWQSGFAGVINLEVFNFDDFTASHAALLLSWERYEKTRENAQ